MPVPSSASLPPAAAYNRILVLRPDERLGNAVLTSGLLARLRASFPAAELDWLLCARHAPLFADNALAVRVLAFDKRALFTRPWRWAAFMRHLRARRYDAVIDASHAHAPSRTALGLMRLCAAPVRVGHAHPARAGVLTHAVASDPDAHDGERKQRLADALGCSGPLHPLWTGALPAATVATVDSWLRDEGLSRPLLLWPGSRKPDRRLGRDVWRGLRESLAGMGDCVVGWGPGEEKEARFLADFLGGRPIPPLDSRGLAALCARSAAYIGHDTGPLHLAVACGLPTACLYPPGSEAASWAWREPPHLTLAVDAGCLSLARRSLATWLSGAVKRGAR